jgi:N-acetylneuraminate synthase
MAQININGRIISSNHEPYIIAELSGNHNGDLGKALAIMEEAKAQGADAIKIQTYTADTLTIDSDKEDFLIKGGLWDGYKLYDLYKWAHTPWQWHEALFNKAKELDITIFSSPFDETAIDFLETLNCPAYKIASFECMDFPLIKKAASTGKPLIISTGMANLDEITQLVDYLTVLKVEQYALLHCISSYPAPIDESNLKTMQDLGQRFNKVVGLSDHTLGTTVSTTGVALGAAIIEKHFILSREDGGPDAAFSIEPDELKNLCHESKVVFSALGKVTYDLKEGEKQNTAFRRSIYVVEDIKTGESFNTQNTRRIRPSYGLSPVHYETIIGKMATQNITRGTPLHWDMITDDK